MFQGISLEDEITFRPKASVEAKNIRGCCESLSNEPCGETNCCTDQKNDVFNVDK